MSKIYGRISGWGAYTPERIVTNDELAQIVETDHQWIVQRTGIHERRIAGRHETTATMSVAAGQKALIQAGLAPEELDLIIVATSTPDHAVPPVSSQVQYALGAKKAAAFVLTTGCSGFVYALTTAYQFIESGIYQNILVIGAELLSRLVNWQDRNTCILFGDGAGAVVIQATDQPCGLSGIVLGSDGSQAQQIIIPVGGSAQPFRPEVDGRQYIEMDGREVFKFATGVVGRACQQAVARAGLTLDEIDWIIPHQANRRIIETAARQMKVPLERFIINIDRYANTSAASIPLALAEAVNSGRIKPTDKLLLVAFGAGLTWGAAVLQMEPDICPEVKGKPLQCR